MQKIALDTATLATFGSNRDVLAYQSLVGEATPQTLEFTVGNNPINITNYTFSLSLRRQTYDSAKDNKSGYSIKGMTDDTTATVIDLTSSIQLIDAANGKVMIYFPASLTVLGSDNPTIYAGFFEFQDNASTGELIQKIQHR